MRTPLYHTLSKEPAPARFGEGCRINDFIVASPAFSHAYLIETPEGSILVNTGMGMEAPVIDANLSALSGQMRNIRYIISTQGHVDHVGGVQYFRDRNPGVEYLAQAGNPEHQALDARIAGFRARRSAFRFTGLFMEAFAHYAEHGYRGNNPQDRPTPDITFDEEYRFTLGGLEVVLYGLKGAETNDSLIVWLPQHRICLAGNLFGCLFGHFPNLVTVRGDKYRDALVIADTAQRLLDLQPETLLYGRHDPIIGRQLIHDEITAIRAALLYVHDEVVKGMNNNRPLHELMATITLPPEIEVGQGYGKVAWSVRAIWENYAGWFHHQSTTELYCVPPSAIHADLVELAGAEALLGRAEALSAAGAHEKALHLLDIVLGAEPANPGALALAIRVHETLLGEPYAADNFWLRGWIEHRIAQLKGALTPSGNDADRG